MVTGYTATEYGDILIASLQDPFENVTKITNVELVIGLTTEFMTGVIATQAESNQVLGLQTQFTSSFNSGDTIIIGNVRYTIDEVISQTELTLTENLTFTLSGLKYYRQPGNGNQFEYSYRWSQDNQVYSEFLELNNGLDVGDIKTLTFDPVRPLYIDTKLEVAEILSGNSMTLLSINYSYIDVDGQVESCPNYVECDSSGTGDGCDPFASDGCANISVACGNDSLYNPYNLGGATGVSKQLTNMVSNIFGHTVQYFRTEPDKRTSDVILMEYSLHNVVDKQEVKILVPDNEFPTEAHTYDIFGIEFAEFEVHITAEEFERAFGYGKTPRNKDYMFIPIMNKMYEINSMSIADEFNLSNSYWRIQLVKYQERSSVIKNEFEVETDTLVTGIEEIFGEEQREEMEKDTNPQQLQTVTTTYRDGNREFVSKDLKIIAHQLKNRWTVVSKNYYDLTEGDLDENAVFYTAKSSLGVNEDAAFTGWFSPQFDELSIKDYFLFGDVQAMGGFKLKVNNQAFKIEIDGNSTQLMLGITFDKNKWYGYVVNLNNTFVQMSIHVYELEVTSNIGIPQSASNELTPIFDTVINLTAQSIWNTNTNYALRFNDMYMTNLRLFNKPIELEQHSNILNQYVVRDNHISQVIDNAIPSLGFQKFVNSK